jgi:proteasome lid subunit RPN8/RPN11
VLLEVYEHARECYPEECCGVLVGPRGEAPRRAYRCTNVQNRLYAAGKSTLDARHGFWIDETDLMTVTREAEEAGEQVMAVYHSHVDTGAYLSQADVRGALGPGGEPLWPAIGYLVVSVQGGTVRGAGYFEWDEGEGAFVGRPVQEAP